MYNTVQSIKKHDGVKIVNADKHFFIIFRKYSFWRCDIKKMLDKRNGYKNMREQIILIKYVRTEWNLVNKQKY